MGSLGVGVARPAAACAACGCGDPTLTTLGTEQPFAGRLRASLTAQLRTDEVGTPGEDELALREARFDAALAWAPHERLFLVLTVPTLWRRIEYVNLASQSTFGLGDAELRAKGFVWRDQPFSPNHLVSLTAGVKLPTAPEQKAPDGEPLPIELQPGTGSFDPLAGASYSAFAGDWSFYASTQLTWPTGGNDGFRGSRSLRGTLAAQAQVTEVLALRGGFDSRYDGKSLEDGEESPDSGGFIGFALAELLVSPAEDLLLLASARIPVVNALDGEHREGPFWSLGVAYDF
jgi:hypothetical protein